jgi:hypothetical protein
MFTYYRAVRKASARIAEAGQYTTGAFQAGRVEQEPAITDRMLARIETALNGVDIGGIQWTAKTLTDRGKGSQESQYGADFLGTLNIDLPDFKVQKGFLAQSKILERLDSAGVSDLQRQCEKMLKHSPASYVFLYSKETIDIVPAISVLGSTRHPNQLYKRSLQRFFEEHLECFIGDRSIKTASPETLSALSDRANARSALYISGIRQENEQAVLHD